MQMSSKLEVSKIRIRVVWRYRFNGEDNSASNRCDDFLINLETGVLKWAGEIDMPDFFSLHTSILSNGDIASSTEGISQGYALPHMVIDIDRKRDHSKPTDGFLPVKVVWFDPDNLVNLELREFIKNISLE